MAPQILENVLSMSATSSEASEASVKGADFPAILQGDGNSVQGRIIRLTDMAQLAALDRFENRLYTRTLLSFLLGKKARLF
ncbi:hypothetical protein M422DRAFT_240198 [Sphaerobolus stellatus SS14]|nr:hypothetical protein M422DRAFT_240198 [Sphaerobolus stellatus SS14]